MLADLPDLTLITRLGTVDTVLVDRFLAGDRSLQLTEAERTWLARVILATGQGPSVVADTLSMSHTKARDWCASLLPTPDPTPVESVA